MASVLARLADAASRRRRLVIGAWLALLVGGAWFSLHQSDRLSGGGWDVPGSASVRVSDELDAFPDFSSPALSVLVTGRSPLAVQKRLGCQGCLVARSRRPSGIAGLKGFPGASASRFAGVITRTVRHSVGARSQPSKIILSFGPTR